MKKHFNLTDININKEKNIGISTSIELLKKFEEKETLNLGKKLNFSNVGNYDVYNISAPINIGKEEVLIGRVEKRKNISDSHIMFFKKDKEVWLPIENFPLLPLEDGFITHIKNETIIGGVSVYPDYTKKNTVEIGYKTDFYKGADIQSLEKFTSGPEKMKDIRLIGLPNGKIGIFTRPQGGNNKKGRIGYCEINNLDELNKENILNAKIIENQFSDQEWGGVNDLHILEDGSIGVIGHIAYQDNKEKHYYAISFIFDSKTHTSSPLEIIAIRKNFPEGDAKSSELKDVIFTGGLVRNNDNTATLYVGLSDVEAGSIVIKDPFSNLKK